MATARTPTCATCAEAVRARRARCEPGFTLVELVVALALAALAVALVPPAMQRLGDSIRYRDTVRSVIAELRVARQRALIESREVRFVIDLAARQFGLDDGTRRALPEPLQMRVTVAGNEWSAQQVGAIRFLAQGGATGGHVDVLRADGQGVRITVDWLSGAVSQAPASP